MNGEILCDGVCVPEDVSGACGPSALKHVGSFLPQTLNCEPPGNKEPCIHIPSRAFPQGKQKSSNSSCTFPLAAQATAQGPHLKGAPVYGHTTLKMPDLI